MSGVKESKDNQEKSSEIILKQLNNLKNKQMIYKNFVKKVLKGNMDIAFQDSETAVLETILELDSLVFSVLDITNKTAKIRVVGKYKGEVINEIFKGRVRTGNTVNIVCNNNFKCSTKLKLIR